MKIKYELSKSKALKLVKVWRGHIDNDTCAGDCVLRSSHCPIDKFFKELEKRFKED